MSTGRREDRKIIDLFFLPSRLPVQIRPLPGFARRGRACGPKMPARGLRDRRRMKLILVLHATREGYTRQIAEHVAATLRARGLGAAVHNVAEIQEPFDLEGAEAAILMASLHAGR